MSTLVLNDNYAMSKELSQLRKRYYKIKKENKHLQSEIKKLKKLKL